MMSRNGFAARTAGALAAGVIGLGAVATGMAVATAAPAGNAQQTIDELRAQGYRVIVSRLSSTPLTEANVVGVRHGQDYSQNWIIDDEDRDYVYNALAGRTVYVDVS